jgi:Flp pilus assembly protein TadG
MALERQALVLSNECPKMSVQPNRRRHFFKLCRDRQGTAALEFALIALPFLVLAFGIMELGCIFWGNYELDNLTTSAARLVRTGEAQSGKLTQAQMVERICGGAVVLTNCATKLKISVQTFNNFASVAGPTPKDDKGKLQKTFPYQPGGPSQVVLVTSFYEWRLFGPSSIGLLSNLADGNRLLQSSAVIQTEPFPQS